MRVPADGWPRAYRPLRPRSLLLQLAFLVGAEVLLFLSYAAHDARFHWATHFLVGLIATAIWQSLHLLIAARPARGQLAAIVVFHLWAMWPDLAFRAGVPHYGWMDWVALGHIHSHYLPYGDTGWLVLGLLAAGGYAVLLWRWLAARQAEAVAGLAPALGVGGAAVLRPQRDPRTHQLAHDELGREDDPEPLVLLHGLGGTEATWLPAARLLAAAGRRCIVPDLLGFGASLDLGTVFRLEDQAAAVLRLLDHHGIARAHLVAHSWGATVAGTVATIAPHRVARLTLVTPAVFADPAIARERFGRRSRLARMTLDGSDVGGLMCGTMCLVRPLVARLAPRIEGDVPSAVARGAVQHSYPAYRDALQSMWQGNPLPALLRRPAHPVTVVLADDDETVLPGDVLDLPPSPEVTVHRVPGTHALPYTCPELVAGLVTGSV